MEISAHLAQNKLEEQLKIKQSMQDKSQYADIKQQVNNSSTQTAIQLQKDKEMQVNFESNI